MSSGTKLLTRGGILCFVLLLLGFLFIRGIEQNSSTQNGTGIWNLTKCAIRNFLGDECLSSFEPVTTVTDVPRPRSSTSVTPKMVSERSPQPQLAPTSTQRSVKENSIASSTKERATTEGSVIYNTYPTTVVYKNTPAPSQPAVVFESKKRQYVDGVSTALFEKQVDALYNSFSDNENSSLDELSETFTTASLTLTGSLKDITNSPGQNGYVLISTNSGVRWVATSTLGLGGSSGLFTTDIDTSSELAAILTDETGSGSSVFSLSPAFGGTATFASLTATGTATFATTTQSGRLTLSGTNANIALGSNYLSGDGDDEGVFVGSTGSISFGPSTESTGSFYHFVFPDSGAQNGIRFTGLRSVTGGSATRFEFRAPNSPSPINTKNFDLVNINNKFSGSGNALQFRQIDDTESVSSGILAISNSGTTVTPGGVMIGSYANSLVVAPPSNGLIVSGNVGIGTTTPSRTLTVAGDARVTGKLYDSVNSGGTNGQILRSTAAGQTWVATSTLGLSSSFSTSAQLAALLSDETGTGRSVFSLSPAFSGTAIFTNFTATGTATFATTTQSGRLTLSGTAANIALGSNYLSGDGGDEGIFVSSTGNVGIGTTTSSAPLSAPALNVWGGMRVGTSSTAFFVNPANGNIGIGTELTSVGGTSVIAGRKYVTVRGSNGSGVLQLTSSAAEGSNVNLGNIEWVDTNSTASDKRFGYVNVITSGSTVGNRGSFMAFGTKADNVSSASERMRITSTGNVGIGTLVPNATLQVTSRSVSSTTALFTGFSGAQTADILQLAKSSIHTPGFVFTATGNVGIGTTTPSRLLTVAGDARIIGALYDTNNSAGTLGMVLQSTATGQRWVATSTLGFGASGATVSSVALSAPTGFSVSGSPITSAGTLALSYSAGFEGLRTASSTNWNSFYNTPSTRITAGAGLSWSANTLNCATATFAVAGCITGANWTTFNNKVSSTSIDTSAELAMLLTDETGSGALVFGTSPILSGVTLNGYSSIANASTTNLTLRGKLYDVNNSPGINGMVLLSTATSTRWVATSTLGLGGGSSFSSSAGLAALLSDETGTGRSVFSLSPAFSGTATFANLTATGTATFATTTQSGRLTLSGTVANIALGSNYLSGDGGDEGIFVSSTGNVGIGTTTPTALLTAIGTTEHLRLGYNATNYLKATTNSNGNTTFDAVGTDPGVTFADRTTMNVAGNTITSSTGSLTGVTGLTSTITNSSVATTGVAYSLRGIAVRSGNTPAAALGTAIGVTGIGRYSGSGTLLDAYGLYGRAENIGAGTITDGYSIYADAPLVSTGAMTRQWAGGFNGNVWIAGKVGIGTTTPKGKLSVVLASSTDYAQFSRAGTGARFGIGVSNNGVENILTFVELSTNITRMTLTAGGSLGIGTSTPTAQLHTTGSVRFSNFGAGTVETDANGNLTVSSDERLKIKEGDYTRGLEEILGLQPISFKWKGKTGLDTANIYTGFSAQNVQLLIPEAVGEGKNGFLTLSDRPIIATLVNAVKELAQKFDDLSQKLTTKEVQTDKLCIGEVCVTQVELEALLLNSNTGDGGEENVTEEDESTDTEGGGEGGSEEVSPDGIEEQMPEGDSSEGSATQAGGESEADEPTEDTQEETGGGAEETGV